MMRCLALASVVMVALAGAAATAPDADSSSGEIPAPFAPFEYFLGGWKGTGIPKANRLKGWQEKHSWAWKFAKGTPVGMTVTLTGDKVLTKGQLTYDEAAKRYRLEGTDPADKPVVFTGALDGTGKALVLDRDDPPATGKERLTIRLNSNMIRYTMAFDRQEPGAPQFSRVYDMNMGKEGESFAAAAGGSADVPKCIITGGAATMTVSYEGKTYPICCTGCRDEFNENPAKYVQKALLRAQNEKTKVKTASSSSVGKDDGAFDGLVDDPKPSPKAKAKPAPKAVTASASEKAKEKEEGAREDADSATVKPAADPAAKAASLLRSAQSLDKLGKTAAALKFYQEIVTKYPKTSQAKTAAARIKALEK